MKPAPAKRPLKTLERVLSKAGLASRTDARQWIGAGRVLVNGKLIQLDCSRCLGLALKLPPLDLIAPKIGRGIGQIGASYQ